MPIQAINADEIEKRGLNRFIVWYVVNETVGHVSGFPPWIDEDTKDLRLPPWNDTYERVTPVFLEKKDAETCRFIVSKTAYLQDDRLIVESEVYQDLADRIAESPEFSLQMYDSERANEWFKQFEDILLTREFEESRLNELPTDKTSKRNNGSPASPIENSLSTWGKRFRIFGILTGLLCLWAAGVATKESRFDDWGENGLSWYLVAAGIAAALQGMFIRVLLDAGAEIIRLLRKLENK